MMVWNHLGRAVSLNVLGIWHLENKRLTGTSLNLDWIWEI